MLPALHEGTNMHSGMNITVDNLILQYHCKRLNFFIFWFSNMDLKYCY